MSESSRKQKLSEAKAWIEDAIDAASELSNALDSLPVDYEINEDTAQTLMSLHQCLADEIEEVNLILEDA